MYLRNGIISDYIPRKIVVSTSKFPTQKYKILYNAGRVFQFRITILAYVGFLLLQWRYQTPFLYNGEL